MNSLDEKLRQLSSEELRLYCLLNSSETIYGTDVLSVRLNQSPQGIRTYIYKLRAKLGKDSIINYPRRGYYLHSDFRNSKTAIIEPDSNGSPTNKNKILDLITFAYSNTFRTNTITKFYELVNTLVQNEIISEEDLIKNGITRR